MKPVLRGVPPDIPVTIDARALAIGCNYTFDTAMGPLDLLGHVEPIGDYEALLQHAETYKIEDVEMKLIGLDDLIRVKQHIGRAKDRDSLHQLLGIRSSRKKGQGT